MSFTLTTSDQAALLHGIKVLVYGKAGYGKTTLAATCPAPLILSAESGLLSLRQYQIPVIQITNVDQLVEVLDWLTRAPEATQYQTVFMDSITEIAEVVLANAKKQVKDPRQAYGELIEKMAMTIRAYRDLSGKHVVMVAKQELQKDDNGIAINGPSMPGSKLGPALPYMFDEVFRIGVGKTPEGVSYRFLQTEPDFQYDAKDRSGALDAIEPADLNHVFNKIQGAMS